MNNSESIQHYKLQIALKGGMGFELMTTWDYARIQLEVRTSNDAGTFATISHENEELATCTFRPTEMIGFQVTPVTRLVATGQMPGPRVHA